MSILHSSSRWLLGAIISLLSGVAHAERPVQVLYYQAPSSAPSEACVYAGSTMLAKTELPRSNFSNTIAIPEGNVQLRFLPEPLEEGGKVPSKAPSVKIAEGWSKILLLVFEDKANASMPIRVKAIDASDDVFGPGSIYMMNFSTIRVGGMVGDKQLDLQPNSIEIIKNPISKDGYYPTKLQAIMKKGGKPQRFIKQMWEHNSAMRQVMFILPKPAPQYATYYCAPVRGFELDE